MTAPLHFLLSGGNLLAVVGRDRWARREGGITLAARTECAPYLSASQKTFSP